MLHLLQTLERHRAGQQDVCAIHADDHALSYGVLYDAVVERAQQFGAAGVTAGHRALLRMRNSSDDVVTLLALARIGGDVLLVDPQAPDAEVARAIDAFAPDSTVIGGNVAPMLGRAQAARRRQSRLNLLTSGIAGVPKIVALDWDAVSTTAAAFAAEYRQSLDDVLVATTPLCHSYGLCVGLIATLCAGSTVVLSRGPMTAASIAALARRHRASIIQSVPFYYRLLTQLPSVDLGIVRLCISAGETLPADLRRRWSEQFAPTLANHYGASEVGQIAIDLEGGAGSVGRPIPGCEVALRRVEIDAAGDDVADDQMEICVKARGVASQYISGDLDRDPSRCDGWFATGDCGRFDEQGRLVVTGRTSARITVGGKKVDRDEVEAAIRACPGVTDCAVIGAASKWSGHDVCAFVQSTGVHEEELRTFLSARLSSYKMPKVVTFVNAIPRTATGKIRYGVLRA